MTNTAAKDHRRTVAEDGVDQMARRLSAPVVILSAFLLALVVGLMLPIVLPIGPMYWDLYLYFDAANRILSGQIPVIDPDDRLIGIVTDFERLFDTFHPHAPVAPVNLNHSYSLQSRSTALFRWTPRITGE